MHHNPVDMQLICVAYEHNNVYIQHKNVYVNMNKLHASIVML